MQKIVLITGGNGFLSSHIIAQLLAGKLLPDLQVRTTVRSEKSKAGLLKALESLGLTTDKLSFYYADLLRDDEWAEALENVDFLLSVASPVFFGGEKEKEKLEIAKSGILRLLRFSEQAKVKRVLMTSNFGAIGFSNKNPKILTDETMWTNPEEAGLSIYEKSKLLAEKAAWDYVKQMKDPLEFTTINPVAMLGESLDGHLSGSFDFLKGILSGEMKQIPNIPLNLIDVKDAAELHLRALLTPKAAGERFIASADGQISMLEIVTLVQKERPELARNISTKRLADWMIKIGAPFNKNAREGKLLLSVNRNISNKKAKKILNWTPRSTNEEIILKSVDSMKKFGLL